MSSVTILQKETYLAMLRNAVGSNLFRTLYAFVDGAKEDITDDGNRSCAFFVSSILRHFEVIGALHAGVAGLEKDMMQSGWTKVEKPERGDVLFWEPVEQKSGLHAHCGFYLGNEEAVSNRDTVRTPVLHHETFGKNPDGSPVRKVTAIYTHPFLHEV